MHLVTDARDRYSRQERFYGIGKEGQQRLALAKVLILGAGALGSAIAETMVRAGVGKVIIIDRDYVEWSNLQRQSLYSESDAEHMLPKAVAAARRLQSINSSVTVDGIIADVTVEEIQEYTVGVDLILDASDNFEVRMMLNDISAKERIPWIYGACAGSSGLSMTVVPGESACLHCLLEELDAGSDTCDAVGIIQPAVQMTAAYQTAEALKWLSGSKHTLRGTLVSFDLWDNRHVSIDTKQLRRVDCLTCGEQPTFPFLSGANLSKTAVLCGRDTVQIRPPKATQMDLAQWERRLAVYGQVNRNPYMLSFEAEKHRIALFPDGRVLIHGTKDTSEARSLYHRYFG
jgi:molybdopterin/thiamine biosynthesis adenylyltransferase